MMAMVTPVDLHCLAAASTKLEAVFLSAGSLCDVWASEVLVVLGRRRQIFLSPSEAHLPGPRLLSQDHPFLADSTNAHFSFSELGGPCLMGSKWTMASGTIVQYQFIPLELQEGGICLMFCSKGFPQINSLLLRSVLVCITFWTKNCFIKALTIKIFKKPWVQNFSLTRIYVFTCRYGIFAQKCEKEWLFQNSWMEIIFLNFPLAYLLFLQ